MKTPREFILERHRSAESKLRAIRAEDLAATVRAAAIAENHGAGFSSRFSSAAQRFWQESIWPWRRAWAGVAAIWLGILALNLTTHESPRSENVQTARANPQVLVALREQKQLLAQLLGPVSSPAAIRPKVVGPRSEQRQELFIA